MTKDIPAKKRVTDTELVDALLSYTVGYYSLTSSSVHPKYMTAKIAELRGELLERLAARESSDMSNGALLDTFRTISELMVLSDKDRPDLDADYKELRGELQARLDSAKEVAKEYCDPYFDYDNKALIDKYALERAWNRTVLSPNYTQETRMYDAILSRMSPAKEPVVEDDDREHLDLKSNVTIHELLYALIEETAYAASGQSFIDSSKYKHIKEVHNAIVEKLGSSPTHTWQADKEYEIDNHNCTYKVERIEKKSNTLTLALMVCITCGNRSRARVEDDTCLLS